MQTIINTISGDKLYAWQFTLKDNDDNALDLTGATGTFRAQLETGTALAVEGAIALVTAASGICKYTVQAGEFGTAGRYYAEIEVLFTSGEVTTFTDIVINVKKQLPRTI
jgi:hypothetical protein